MTLASPEKLPIQMLHDRVLVQPNREGGDRRSVAGIVIPATAQVGKRLAWGEVMAVGSTVRAVQAGDQVLYDPEDKGEVELHATTYLLLRERDLHALASERVGSDLTGLYL